MPTFSNPVILPLLFTIFGFLAGALIASIVFGKMNKGEGSSSELPEGLEKGRHELAARLWKDRKSGSLLVEMNEEIHTSSQTLSNVQKLQLTSTQRELGSWLNIPLVAEAPAPVTPVAAPLPITAPTAADASMPLAAPVLSNRPAQANAPTKPKDEAKVPEHPSTMVDQIDEILQEMLENSPLKNRGIKLQNDPRLGAVVWIGITRYDGVDSVDDPEIKQLLRTAVDEWERRTEKDPRWAWKQQG